MTEPNSGEGNTLEAKVRAAASDDSYKLRDNDGCIFWVDSVDEDGVYYHADEGDTHQASWEQVHEWFVAVPTEK